MTILYLLLEIARLRIQHLRNALKIRHLRRKEAQLEAMMSKAGIKPKRNYHEE